MAGLRSSNRVPVGEFATLLAEYERTSTPLPKLAQHHIADRLTNGWSTQDPLLSVATGPAPG
ncbi:hypothetical protein ACIGBH_40855 [Streptomyces sp. NPDC085929]|uniref:hypothetical protein n=1 Tax=Streptomyces sp. NPDC085929 TaxID=3365739 RepID=UPI0037D06AB0